MTKSQLTFVAGAALSVLTACPTFASSQLTVDQKYSGSLPPISLTFEKTQDLSSKSAPNYLTDNDGKLAGDTTWIQATTLGTNKVKQDFAGPKVTSTPEPRATVAFSIGFCLLGVVLFKKRRSSLA